MKSIRRYLTWRLVAGVLIILIAGNVLLYSYVYYRVVRQFDAAMTAKARTFAGMIEQEPEGIAVEFRDEFLPEYNRSHEPEYFQIWTADGKVLKRSPSLERHDLPRRTGPIDAPLFWDMTLPDGREGRAIGVSFFPYIDREDHPEIKTPRGVQVVLARDRSEMPSILGALVIGLFSVLLLTASGILVVVPPLVLAGLRPLKQLADRTASIDLKYPGFRYPGDNLPDELRPIVDRLNGLLQRIEDAFSREKRLSADMAHELKTPVAELRSLAEVALRWPEDSAFVHDALRNTIEIAQEMDRRISVLLALSRNESGEQHVSLSDVDLSGLIRDLWIPWEKMAKEKRIRTKLDIPSIAVVTTDSGMLSSILTNLFSNAVEYCPEGGRFTCSMEQGPEKVRLTMINSNNTLTEEDLPKIFDYLWRKDPARTDGSHIGLGLVLVESFARILDIPIKAELLQGGDFCMTLEISAFSSGEGTTKEES